MMKKQKSAWWQPEGWMRFGSYAVVALVILYLGFIIWGVIRPRLRLINKLYQSASVVRMMPAERS